MKVLSSFLACASLARAHYNFPAMIYGGATTTDWADVRPWTGYYTYDPVTTVSTVDIRCNVNGTTNLAPSVLSVAAGETLGFTANPDIYHPGVLLAYLAKVPSGYTAANWDGSGSVWFKIYEDGPGGYGTQALTWPTLDATTVTITIPAGTPSGDYLVRIEHIALHVANSIGGAQFYLSCGQITVTGGGSGTPGPLVAFPGAYSATDPGILIDIYYPVPTSYTPPGPPVWTGGAGGGSPPPATTVSSSSSTKPSSTSTSSIKTTTSSTTSSSTKTTSTTTTSSTPIKSTTTTSSTTKVASPTGSTVPKYGQCGGIGWTGGTVCAAGSTCTASGPYYSQCL